MNGFWTHARTSLRLHLRNPLALVYGFLFPLLFVGVFAVLYRHEVGGLRAHAGEWLVLGVLGGACFGLPTTIVSERERGLWRRYRLTPVPAWGLVGSVLLVRYGLLLAAAGLQLGLAVGLGMAWPADWAGLWVAFTLAAWAFLGTGLVIAMLADSVPAVQALGQCVFLPMLVIGGVAVPLGSLPEWARVVAGGLPGLPAVQALAAAMRGTGLPGFALGALALGGAAGVGVAALLFRWEVARGTGPRRASVLLLLATWAVVGGLNHGRSSEDRPGRGAEGAETWRAITAADVVGLDFNVPPDAGVIAPIAGPQEQPDALVRAQVATVKERLAAWAPGRDADPVQAVRSVLCIAAVADILQLPAERDLPLMLLDQLQGRQARDRLVRILTWIALHPGDGVVIDELDELGLSGRVADAQEIRARVRLYAIKFTARLTDRPY